MFHSQPTQLKKKRGQATVELALIATFLVLLLVGVADVARIFSEQLSVVHAAGVGARWAVLPANQQNCSRFGNVATVVVADLSSDVPSSNIVSIETVIQTVVPSTPGAVRVNVTYRHDFLFGIIQGIPNTFSTGATMPGTVPTTPGTCPPTPAGTPTTTPTNTPTWTPTNTPTRTPTSPPTWTPTVTPTNTPTWTPTNTPTWTPTNTPTWTPTVTPTNTPTAKLVITQLIAVKPNGNNKPLFIEVIITDGSVGQAGVTIAATANGTPLGGWSYQGNGIYTLCPAGNFSGSGGSVTVIVTASKAGYQNASATTTNGTGSSCPYP
jgi:TadE-like protein